MGCPDETSKKKHSLLAGLFKVHHRQAHSSVVAQWYKTIGKHPSILGGEGRIPLQSHDVHYARSTYGQHSIALTGLEDLSVLGHDRQGTLVLPERVRQGML